jgi:hypothetical protein
MPAEVRFNDRKERLARDISSEAIGQGCTFSLLGMVFGLVVLPIVLAWTRAVFPIWWVLLLTASATAFSWYHAAKRITESLYNRALVDDIAYNEDGYRLLRYMEGQVAERKRQQQERERAKAEKRRQADERRLEKQLQRDELNNRERRRRAALAREIGIAELTPTSMHAMTGQQYERLCGEFFRSQGYSVKYTPTVADGGIDLLLYKGGDRFVVQCKRHAKPVGEPVMRDLYGVVLHEKATAGIVCASSGFTAAATAWVKDKPLTLMDGATVMRGLGIIAEIDDHKEYS